MGTLRSLRGITEDDTISGVLNGPQSLNAAGMTSVFIGGDK